MKTPARRIVGLAAPLMAATVLVGWLAYDWTRGRAPASTPQSEQGRNVLASATPDAAIDETLRALAWNDIAATIEGTNANPSIRWRVLDATARSERAEVRYLRGLLLLASERRDEALTAFLSIAVDRIPPTELYAPYRLHAVLRPGARNPFEAGLRRAATSRQLTPLVDARIAAEQGDLRRALESYLRTDPAGWAVYDLAAFRMLRLHAGLSPDATAMLAAAIRAGRVRADLRPQLLRMLSTAGSADEHTRQRDAFLALLRSDPKARAVAVAAAGTQLRARQRFLEKRYGALVEEYRDSDAVTIPDGTLLMLVLSAHQIHDGPAAEVWSQELHRRYPQDDVTQWLKTLAPTQP